MRKQPVTRRQFLGSGIAAAGAISIGGALPANARDWEKYSARFDRSKDRIDAIDQYMAKPSDVSDIDGRIDTGTLNFAAHMTIPAAIAFHNKIGTATKEARLRYLRNLWVAPARKMKGLTVLTSDDPKMVAALTSFRLDGVTSTIANEAVVTQLAERFGVLTVRRTGPTAGVCIRVTPSVYTSADDVMKLVNALRSITASPKSIVNLGS